MPIKAVTADTARPTALTSATAGHRGAAATPITAPAVVHVITQSAVMPYRRQARNSAVGSRVFFGAVRLGQHFLAERGIGGEIVGGAASDPLMPGCGTRHALRALVPEHADADAPEQTGRRARCVPDRTVNQGDSRSLTDKQVRRLTCIHAAQRARTRSLPSWSCGFDSRHPLSLSPWLVRADIRAFEIASVATQEEALAGGQSEEQPGHL
jgi:hypothetical protein